MELLLCYSVVQWFLNRALVEVCWQNCFRMTDLRLWFNRWLNELLSRPAVPVSGHRGRHPWPAKVIIVATHSDLVTDDETLHADVAAVQDVVSTRFSMHFDLSPTIFVLNAHVAMSPEIKALRSHLGQVKAEVVQVGSIRIFDSSTTSI